MELDEKALRIASRYTAERENGMGYSQCFLLGNLAVHGGRLLHLITLACCTHQNSQEGPDN